MDNIFKDVLIERERQDKKWGKQNHTLLNWHLILSEEWGEVSKEVNEVIFRAKAITELRKELIQTIAVTTRLLELIDNG